MFWLFLLLWYFFLSGWWGVEDACCVWELIWRGFAEFRGTGHGNDTLGAMVVRRLKICQYQSFPPKEIPLRNFANYFLLRLAEIP